MALSYVSGRVRTRICGGDHQQPTRLASRATARKSVNVLMIRPPDFFKNLFQNPLPGFRQR
jgi:hypothetical protein